MWRLSALGILGTIALAASMPAMNLKAIVRKHAAPFSLNNDILRFFKEEEKLYKRGLRIIANVGSRVFTVTLHHPETNWHPVCHLPQRSPLCKAENAGEDLWFSQTWITDAQM